jgi:hypothetical protein
VISRTACGRGDRLRRGVHRLVESRGGRDGTAGVSPRRDRENADKIDLTSLTLRRESRAVLLDLAVA